MPEELKPLSSYIAVEGKKWLINLAFTICGILFMALLTPVGNQLKEVWNEPASRAAADVEMIAALKEFGDTQKKMLTAINELTGDDRITRQPLGMSYVTEPVNAEDDFIELVMFIGRTSLGATCILEEVVPRYIDTNNVVTTLKPRRGGNQLGTDVIKVVIELERPHDMIAGRTGVDLQLRYTCGSKTVFENTNTIYFYNVN